MLGIHDVVRPPISLSCNNGDFRDRRFAKCVKELGALSDDTSPFLVRSGQETGYVLKDNQGNIEGIAEANKSGSFNGRIDVQDPCQDRGLVRDDPDRPAAESREADDDIRRIESVHLEEIGIIDDQPDHLLHVVGLARIFRNDRV